MKVLHMLDSLNRGGTEVLALDVCRNARAHGLDLICAATGGGTLETEFQQSGVEFTRFDRRLPVDLKLAARLRAFIRKNDVRVVHTHQAVEALHAYIATRGLRVKLVLTFHLCAADKKNQRALKFLVPRTAANVAVSRDLLACLHTHAQLDTTRNFHVVHNGVDAHRLTPTGHSLRAELGLTSEHLMLGMIGNFYADMRKDQLTVCRALAQLFAVAPHARFVFVGAHAHDAPQAYEECVRFCHAHGLTDRVHFLGPRADIPDILHALDLFVFSSRADSFGMAVVEAMMTGVPTVVSDIGALREVTGDGTHAALFRTGDANDLARCMITLINDEARRAQLGQRGQQWATAQFSIAAHIAGLRRLYNGLMTERTQVDE